MPIQGDLDRRILVEALVASSNVPLPDEDQAIIRELIVEAQEELGRLETALQGASGDALDTLLWRRTTEIERIARLRVGIAAHTRLPPELLAKIFAHCHQGYAVNLRSLIQSSLPWAICSVCSRWREIALAEPRLWALVRLPPMFSQSKHIMERIRRILSRYGGAGKVTLSAELQYGNDWKTLLDLVSTYSSRVNGLRLRITDVHTSHLDHPVGVFDILETLTITFDYPHGYREARETPIAAFALARNLRKLRIYCSDNLTLVSSAWLQRILFPWSTLTELDSMNISLTATLKILAQCTQITRLAMTFLPHETPHHGPFNPISLPQLLFLYITPNRITNLTEFLDSLVLTNLKTLTFGPGISEPWPQKTMLKLLSPSNHSMESLETSDFITPGDCILPLMRALPHLVELSVCTDNSIPEGDFLTMKAEKIAPKLQVFRDWEASNYRVALDFLNSRWLLDEQGRYDGIREARFFIPRINVVLDSVNFYHSVSQMQKNGRVIIAEDY